MRHNFNGPLTQILQPREIFGIEYKIAYAFIVTGFDLIILFRAVSLYFIWIINRIETKFEDTILEAINLIGFINPIKLSLFPASLSSYHGSLKILAC